MTGVSKDYLLITEAAEFLPVAPNTLRSWGSQGKIEEFRHPINNYRLPPAFSLYAFAELKD